MKALFSPKMLGGLLKLIYFRQDGLLNAYLNTKRRRVESETTHLRKPSDTEEARKDTKYRQYPFSDNYREPPRNMANFAPQESRSALPLDELPIQSQDLSSSSTDISNRDTTKNKT